MTEHCLELQGADLRWNCILKAYLQEFHPEKVVPDELQHNRFAPVAEDSRFAVGDSPPAAEGSRPAAEGSRPAVEGNRLAVEGSRPAAEDSRPAAENSRLAAEGSRPAEDSRLW